MAGRKFHGTLEELKEKLAPILLEGEWRQQPNGVWKFSNRDRSGLLWSETKGTIWCDGPPAAKAQLESRLEGIFEGDCITKEIPRDSTIFVVHGRDHEARDQLELVLRRLGLEPFVLQVTAGAGIH